MDSSRNTSVFRHRQHARATLLVALLVFGTGLFASARPARTKRADEAPKPDNAVAAKDEAGLVLTIEAAKPSPVPDKRISRLLAIEVPHGAAPSAFTSAGPFKATFEGDINMRLRDFLFFSAVGHGKLTLKINDKPALELTGDFADKPSQSTRLGKGKNHVVAIYEPPEDGPAELRLFWYTKTTLPEPVSPIVFTHTSADPVLADSLRVRQGRMLVAQLRCTKCHATTGIITPADKSPMPELAMDAPSLEGIGSRLNADWMAAWISNPRAFRPASHMPRLFASKDAIAAEARDIAAYLATLATPAPAPAADAGNADLGGRLFANLDCVACHIPPERSDGPQEALDAGRISLAFVKAKFKPGAIRQFLLNPAAHYAWISMPNFRFSDDEASNLTAYLLSVDNSPVAPAPPGNAANGAKLITSVGCTNCHSVGPAPAAQPSGSIAALAAIPKDGWSRGCMASDAATRKSAPDFSLTDDQRAAIAAFGATGGTSLAHDAAPEFAEREIAALRCTACHARDGRESLLATDLDAENQELHTKHPTPIQGNGEGGAAPDQRAPMITWAGEKLRPEWMEQFIAGKIPYKPRYYLRARMPGFAIRAAGLAQGFTQEHGCLPTYPAYGPPDKKLAEIGQGLAGRAPNVSFSCVQCHAINQQPPLAPFEAPSINFMYATSRLRQDYYFRWIHDPLRIDPESKMPRYDDADGKTGVPTFDHDAHKQFEALWNYMLEGKDIVPPGP